jgi:hypothetical protein
MGVNYAWEKFFTALDGAVLATDSLQQRLAGAVMGLQTLEPDDLPNDETRNRFQLLRKETPMLDSLPESTARHKSH